MDTTYELDQEYIRELRDQVYRLQRSLLAVVGGLELVHEKFATGERDDEIANMAVGAILDSVKDDVEAALAGVRHTDELRQFYSEGGTMSAEEERLRDAGAYDSTAGG